MKTLQAHPFSVEKPVAVVADWPEDASAGLWPDKSTCVTCQQSKESDKDITMTYMKLLSSTWECSGRRGLASLMCAMR